ncbi:MAG TPA: hypothetical protein VFY44_10965 [Thermoleophilaceae bacterium]|nr:hypothetical protein [Thermoleophilaceae bacterium]
MADLEVSPEALTSALQAEDPAAGIVAAGDLRQGKRPSMVALMLGYGLIVLMLPRKSKQLSRRFVLIATENEVIARRAWSGGGEHEYLIKVGDRLGSWPRDQVWMDGFGADGTQAASATLHLAGQTLPVSRPNLSGDPNTDELFLTLGRAG